MWESVHALISHPWRLQCAYEKEIEGRCKRLRDDPEHETRILAASLAKLEHKQEFLLDLATETSTLREKVRAKMAELEDKR